MTKVPHSEECGTDLSIAQTEAGSAGKVPLMSDWLTTGLLLGAGLTLGLTAVTLGYFERLSVSAGMVAVSASLLILTSAAHFSPLAQLTGG